jgi:choline-sulfatase
MSPSDAPRRSAAPEGPAASSALIAAGPTLALALVAAVVASVPATARAFRAGGSLVGATIVGTAILLPVVAGLLTISRAASRGFRLVTGRSLAAGQSTTLALFVGLVAPVLLALGTLLKDGTNHRGLGGATFAVLSLFMVVAMAFVSVRIITTGNWLVTKGLPDRIVALLLAAVAVLPTVTVGFVLLRGSDGSSVAPFVTAAVIDGLLLAVVSAAALSFDLGERWTGLGRRFGVPIAGAVFVVGAMWLMLSAPLSSAMQRGGGLASTLVGRLERWTDRDGDGAGSHFGGRDCDDGDAQRSPGALDVPGDGIDQDCDGHDAAILKEEAPRSASPAPATPSQATPQATPTMGAPHVVLVTLESVRADHLNLYGYGQETSPKLTAIAARGVVFDHAFSPASDPQRAVMPLFSGRRFADTPRDRREWPTLKDEAETLAERLKGKGYETHGISSFQWLSRERGFAQGFDEFVEIFRDEHPERGVTGPLALRSFRATLERLDPTPKPQFIWLHLFDAHEEWRRHDGLAFGKGETGAYDSEIAFVDRLLGDVDAALAKSPLGGKTLLVVHGTYGESLGERSKQGTRAELTNEHVRVPLVVAGPGITPARISDRAVSTSRVPELILSRAGVAPAEDLLTAAAPPVLLETTRRRAVVVFPWKLVASDRKGKERLLLFHLVEDPGETKDRSGDEPEKLRELSALLDASLPKPKKRDARR